MIKEDNYNYDIYKIATKEPIDIKKIIILVLMIVIVICLIMIAKNSLVLINQQKIYKQYEAQLIALQKQEEEKQAEEEKIRQEKIPKLTQERQNKHGKYLSFRK
jgi:biopolymer transport protein ExbB/TolQ